MWVDMVKDVEGGGQSVLIWSQWFSGFTYPWTPWLQSLVVDTAWLPDHGTISAREMGAHHPLPEIRTIR